MLFEKKRFPSIYDGIHVSAQQRAADPGELSFQLHLQYYLNSSAAFSPRTIEISFIIYQEVPLFIMARLHHEDFF